MKENELRIGNLVKSNNILYRKDEFGKLMSVLGINDESATVTVIEDCNQIGYTFGQFFKYLEPIIITEEILFNCGFSKNVGHYIVFGRYKDKTLEVAYNNDTNETQYYVYVRGLLDNEFVQLRHDLKYLHELQNLYFAITGNELIVSKK